MPERRSIADLSGRVVLVTGAGSGLGLAISRVLSKAEAHVIGVDLDPDGEVRFADAIRGAGAGYAALDVTDRRAVSELIGGLDRLDVLINSAGIRDVGGVFETTPEVWERVISVNLTGTFNCCQAAAQVMACHGSGSIVNIASTAGMFGFALRTAYTASKHGVVGLTRTLAAQLGPLGIRVNAVCPGLIETPMTAAIVSDPGVQESLRVLVPIGRAGHADEIADAALFLAGDGSRFITGVPLPVDGGATAFATYDATGSAGSAFEQHVSVNTGA
jgi:meso-butanediol dehydrogenase/(S,S)-butanediol dehydrogenase/diacetyl reductase